MPSRIEILCIYSIRTILHTLYYAMSSYLQLRGYLLSGFLGCWYPRESCGSISSDMRFDICKYGATLFHTNGYAFDMWFLPSDLSAVPSVQSSVCPWVETLAWCMGMVVVSIKLLI